MTGTKFYDLGSGTGKAVFVARFLHDFDACQGIEILEGLHTAGLEVVNRYNRHFREVLELLIASSWHNIVVSPVSRHYT